MTVVQGIVKVPPKIRGLLSVLRDRQVLKQRIWEISSTHSIQWLQALNPRGEAIPGLTVSAEVFDDEETSLGTFAMPLIAGTLADYEGDLVPGITSTFVEGRQYTVTVTATDGGSIKRVRDITLPASVGGPSE